MNKQKGRLNAISLFSGYGGIDLALAEYARPLLYCDIEKYAQGILLSRMDDELIDFAPVWNDVATLDGKQFNGMVDIIYGGFPCQDISVAGKAAGLEGKRSGLFYEIIRLAKEINPTFLYLENVPAIRTRGLREVVVALGEVGYDCRWTCISAASVGANHKRERWFLLAHARSARLERQWKPERVQAKEPLSHGFGTGENDSHSVRERLEGAQLRISKEQRPSWLCREWWKTEPDVGRVANGVAFRMDRIKALGNGVVPLQVKKAFEILMGVTA